MGFWRSRPGRPSKREVALSSNATHRFYAAASENPDAQENLQKVLVDVAPKRVVRRPVDGQPVRASEHQEQSAVIRWWALAHQQYQLPEFALFAVPNGGARDVITGARLKAEGVRPGALDLILAKPTAKYHGLFIEMKVGDNKPSDKQKAFIAYLDSVVYKTTVHWNAGSAIKEIEEYLA